MEKINSWTIFTIRGVAIKLHVSLIFLLFYIFLIAIAQFPFVVTQSGVQVSQVSGTPFAWALIFSISIVISIFLHEFGHVLVAQSMGARVRQITLMMLGGVSQLERLPEKKYGELKVAIVGPLVSFVIAGILFFLRSSTSSATLSLFGYWVGQTNLALAIFNLLPAFPTDGGRILRSILVARRGKIRGTEIAVKVSSVFVWIFGILGLLQFNMLLILIAFFIYLAGRSELFILVGQNLLRGMTAHKIGTYLPAVSEDATVSQAAQKMVESHSLELPVAVEHPFYAVVNLETLNRIPKNQWDSIRVKEVKIEVPKAVKKQDSLDEVFATILTSTAGALPLIEDGKIVGLVRSSDLIETIQLQSLSKHPHLKMHH